MALITFDDKDSSLPTGSSNPRKKIRDSDINEIKNVVNTNASGSTSAIQAAIDALIDGAPGALNTLNELAAAINDDAAFATTVAASLSAKQDNLVSGTNIKTVNSVSVLGSGNIPLVDDTIADGVTTRAPSQEAVFEALALKATIAYVDDAVSGVVSGWKEPADTATTADITLSGEQTIDGVLTSASRVLVKNQSSALQNGIYTTAAGAWSRATDSNTAVELEGAAVTVSAGTTQANTTWVQTSDNITLETTAIAWSPLGTSVQDASSSVKGVARLYPSTSLGSNTDGAPDQNAVKVYVDAKVADAINNGTTTIAPSQNAVFDALALKATIASPTFTGTPAAPTASANNNSTQLATTAYVDAKVTDSLTASSSVAPSKNAVNTALALKASFTSFAKRVAVTGTKDGVNNTFGIPQPLVLDSEELFRGGQLQYPPTDYTISGQTITTVIPPESWESLAVNYIRP
jgi:hypothetical protein